MNRFIIIRRIISGVAMKKRSGVKFWSVAVLATIWIIAAVTISLFYFLGNIDKHIEEHAATSLRDVSKSITQILQNKIGSQWETLAPAARYAGGIDDMLGSEHIVQLLGHMKSTSKFTSVYVSDHVGNSVNNDGGYVNISDRYYFKKAMQGYSNISQILKSRATGDDVFVFSSPIYGEHGPQGAIGAAIKVEDFQKLIDISSFDGRGYTYVVTGNGDILLEPLNNNLPISENNILDFLTDADRESSISKERLKNDMMHRQNGYFTFIYDGAVQSAYYMPLEINDWYAICGVPHSFLKKKSHELFTDALVLCLGIIIAMIPAVFAIIIRERQIRSGILKRNRELLWNEERLRIVTSLSNSTIFETDLLGGTIIFPGDTAAWKGFTPEEKGFPHSIVESGFIHPEDGEAFIRMHTEIPPNTKKITGDFRFKTAEGGYSWYRIEESLFFDDNGRAVRSIGRALDVDNEKKAIALLKARAKADSYTGLLNKQATEREISKLIQREEKGNHALIIVDIDGFKSVNDTKGHIYGDHVIIDVSNILKEQFRSTDIVGRIGGDEFMIFIKDIPDNLFVEEKINTIRILIKEKHQMSLSIGIAVYPGDGTTYMDLYKNADDSLYWVKKSGKDGFGFYADIRSAYFPDNGAQLFNQKEGGNDF